MKTLSLSNTMLAGGLLAAALTLASCDSKFEDIVVYNSITSDGTNNAKTKAYQENKAFIIKGNPKKFIKYVRSIAN